MMLRVHSKTYLFMSFCRLQDWLSFAGGYPLSEYSSDEKLCKLNDFEVIEMKSDIDHPLFLESAVASHHGLANEKLSSNVFIKLEEIDCAR